MKKLILANLSAYLICIGSLTGQSLISPASHSITTDSYSFTGSIGEPLTLTLSSEAESQTQGFHQPSKMGVICNPCDLVFDVPNSSSDPLIDFTISPNPTHSLININALTEFEQAELNLAIFNSEGKVLFLEKASNDSERIQRTIDISTYKSGQHFIRIYDTKRSMTQSFIITH